MKKILHNLLPILLVATPGVAMANSASFALETSASVWTMNEDNANPLAVTTGAYPTNYSETQDYTRNDRHLDGIVLNGSADGNQKYEIPAPRKVYTKALHKVFTAKAGETLSASFMYSGNWMNGFVYLDRNQDGQFAAELDADKRIPEGSDIMAFSNYEGINSKGQSTGNMNVLNPPAFTLPADLPNGIYRLRYKVDWSWMDPAGRNTTDNSMLKNGGAICDVLLNVHGDFSNVSASAVNGAVTDVEGKALNNQQVAFGKPLTIKVAANEGFACEGIQVRHGYKLDGDSLVNENPQYKDEFIPSYMIRNGECTLPAAYIDGDVQVEALFYAEAANPNAGKGDYVLNFDKQLKRANAERVLKSMTFRATKGGSTSLNIENEENTVYCDQTAKQISVVPGDKVNVSFAFTGAPLHYYLYIDLGQDGHFTPIVKDKGVVSPSSELVSYSYYNGYNSNGEAIANPVEISTKSMPAFVVPSVLPNGVYRARLVVGNDNIDPAGEWKEGAENQIDAQGGYVVDFLMNVHDVKHSLYLSSTNGNIYGANNSALPMDLDVFRNLTVYPTPVAAGYQADGMTIKHGHNFDGPQYIHGNRQWSEYTAIARGYTIPRDSVNGDVQITVHFEESADAAYKLVFSDEFNGENFTEPEGSKWSRCVRMGATWNRWLSDSKEVVYLKDGNLVTRAIPNPDQKNDPVPMITGGIKSQKKFGFTYGKVECRAKVESWVGTFPAIWLMPEDQSAGWPSCGEIDIFEAIDAQQTAYGTIHSHWTYDLGHKNDPQSAFNTSCNMDRYHTYGLEWDENNVSWYVDGKLMGTYKKSTNQNALNQGQWPYDKHFYLILNQSVGNGSWARPADENHTYEFFIDWVRVYQKDGMQNTDGVVGLMDVNEDDILDVTVLNGALAFSATQPVQVAVYDLQGRQIYRKLLQGEDQISLAQGIYVVNGKKVFVR